MSISEIQFTLDHLGWQFKKHLSFDHSPEHSRPDAEYPLNRSALSGGQPSKELAFRVRHRFADQMAMLAAQQFLHALPLLKAAIVERIISVEKADPGWVKRVVRVQRQDLGALAPTLSGRGSQAFPDPTNGDGLLVLDSGGGVAVDAFDRELRVLRVLDQELYPVVLQAGPHQDAGDLPGLLRPEPEVVIGFAVETEGRKVDVG